MGMEEGGSAARGCLGAFSFGVSSSSSGVDSSFFGFSALGAASFFGVGSFSFLGAIVNKEEGGAYVYIVRVCR